METKTVAQVISAKFNDDGSCFVAGDGRQILDVLEEECTRKREVYDNSRYEFTDGSSIVISGGAAWDIGHPAPAGCFCWEGAGHAPDCEERAVLLVVDEEHSATDFWEELRYRRDCPLELECTFPLLSVEVTWARAQEILEWCRTVEGFEGWETIDDPEEGRVTVPTGRQAILVQE